MPAAMNETASEPKPRKSRRMVVWMVVVPIVILLLALAGANWKFFHLAYAKHLIGSEDSESQADGVRMIYRTHLREGMKLEEVERLFRPAGLIRLDLSHKTYDVIIIVDRKPSIPLHYKYALPFDDEGRLKYVPYLLEFSTL